MVLRSFLGARLILVALVLLSIIAAFISYKNVAAASLKYTTEVVDQGDITQQIFANGTLNPVTVISIGSRVSGTVINLSVDFNDQVSAGQVLAKMDDTLLRTALMQSEANFNSAKAGFQLEQVSLDRIVALEKDGFVSRQELDNARQLVRDAKAKMLDYQAQVERDKANIGYSIIRSPISGIIVSRAIDAGQTVAASFNTPELFKIAHDLRKMQIEAFISEADIAQIEENMPVNFRVDSFMSESFQGKVKQIRLNPKTESNVVAYNVVVDVDNSDLRLIPGMTAYVDVAVTERRNTLRIPNAALRFRPSEALLGSKNNATTVAPKIKDKDKTKLVYLLSKQGTVPIPKEVKIGISDRKYTEIIEGDIRPGDQVIIEEVGNTRLPSQRRRKPGFGVK